MEIFLLDWEAADYITCPPPLIADYLIPPTAEPTFPLFLFAKFKEGTPLTPDLYPVCG
jgi:hypothetical protein